MGKRKGLPPCENQASYGDRVIKAVMHLDEATPHIHATLVPLDDKGKLNCRAMFGGSRHTLTELQTDYAKSVEKLGIERGLQGRRATHQEVAKFYAIIDNLRAASVTPSPSARVIRTACRFNSCEYRARRIYAICPP